MNDLHSLASDYAVGSLPSSDTSEFETHLATCPECREEVAEMRDIAVQLSEAIATDPPPSLRAAVLAQIAHLPQTAPPSTETTVAPPAATQPSNVVPFRRRSRATWATGLVAAAALVAAVALGGWAIHSRNQAHDATAMNQELTQLLSAPDVRTASGSFTTAGSGTVIVSPSEGQALLVAKDLPALPSGKVYEAWTLKKHTLPAGTFAAGGSQTVLDLPGTALGASAVAVTVEPSGGSQQPTSTPIFTVKLPRA
jgi:anti-sigma-K factor RskA